MKSKNMSSRRLACAWISNTVKSPIFAAFSSLKIIQKFGVKLDLKIYSVSYTRTVILKFLTQNPRIYLNPSANFHLASLIKRSKLSKQLSWVTNWFFLRWFDNFTCFSTSTMHWITKWGRRLTGLVGKKVVSLLLASLTEKQSKLWHLSYNLEQKLTKSQG